MGSKRRGRKADIWSKQKKQGKKVLIQYIVDLIESDIKERVTVKPTLLFYEPWSYAERLKSNPII